MKREKAGYWASLAAAPASGSNGRLAVGRRPARTGVACRRERDRGDSAASPGMICSGTRRLPVAAGAGEQERIGAAHHGDRTCGGDHFDDLAAVVGSQRIAPRATAGRAAASARLRGRRSALRGRGFSPGIVNRQRDAGGNRMRMVQSAGLARSPSPQTGNKCRAIGRTSAGSLLVISSPSTRTSIGLRIDGDITQAAVISVGLSPRAAALTAVARLPSRCAIPARPQPA